MNVPDFDADATLAKFVVVRTLVMDNPVSLYAATKKGNELMAHAYSKLYNIPSTG